MRAEDAPPLAGPGEQAPGRAHRLLRAMSSTVRRIAGMPDYDAYRAHMAERHPGCAVQTEREYFEDFLEARYGSGVSRCC